jgi:stage II sporulation protein D
MSIHRKSILSSIITILILMVFYSSLTAAVQIPDKVRIGLLYESTAASVLNVSSGKGVQLGFYKDSAFTSLLEEPTGNNIIIRKDAYYIRNNSTFTEYKSIDKAAQSGENLGPYHIQIGGVYNDLNSVNLQIQAIKQKGIVAYPAFTDVWQVWTGFYTDSGTAQKDITNIQNKLGNGTYSITALTANSIVADNYTGDTMLIFASGTSHLQVHPKAENIPYAFKLNNKGYRGDLEIRRFTTSDMTAINVLSIEQYLYGVVPNEIESYSNAEALKAQAVAARTYTVNNLGKHKTLDYDLNPNSTDQMYKGFDGEAASTNKAVDDTKSKLVTYNGKAAQVFYFSSSGGQTEDAKNVWGSDIPYLKSVDDKYEATTSWHYNWEVDLTAAKIKSIMLSRNYDLGDITGMCIAKTSTAGRATDLIIQGSKSKREYTEDDCRNVFSLDSQWYSISTDSDTLIKGDSTCSAVKVQLGDKKLLTAAGLSLTNAGVSKNFTVIGDNNSKKVIPAIPTTYKLIGKGWGHAVGMSQEGAKGMANAGFKYDQILTHYFQDTKVE